MELRDVPAFGDVVHLPQGRGLAVPDHVPDELEDVHRPQEHEGAFELLRAPHAHQVAVLPDRVLRVETDVRLRPEGNLHLRDLPAVEFLVDLLGDRVEAFATLSIRFSSQVILPSSRTSAGFGSTDFGSMPRGRSKWRFNFLPAAVKLWTLSVTVCRFTFLSYSICSSTQTTPIIFVIVASRTGTFLFTIFADLSAIRGRMSWTISNFSFVLARWAFFVRCVLRRRPASFSARSSSVMISSTVATASFDSDVSGTFVAQRWTRTFLRPRLMSRSPIGLRQSVGGDINFALCMASWSAFASSRTRDFGFLSGSRPAASQISFATREDTRTNSSSRKAASL